MNKVLEASGDQATVNPDTDFRRTLVVEDDCDLRKPSAGVLIHHVAPKHNDLGAFSVEQYDDRRKQAWDIFVNAAKNATFLFSRDYMDYHRQRFVDNSLMVFKDRALVAVLPANLNAQGTLISHEGLTYGGLVVSRAATLGDVLVCFYEILHYLSQRQISKLLYKRIPGFYNTLPDDDVAYALFLLDARLYRRDCSTVISQTDRLPLRKNHKR